MMSSSIEGTCAAAALLPPPGLVLAAPGLEATAALAQMPGLPDSLCNLAFQNLIMTQESERPLLVCTKNSFKRGRNKIFRGLEHEPLYLRRPQSPRLSDAAGAASTTAGSPSVTSPRSEDERDENTVAADADEDLVVLSDAGDEDDIVSIPESEPPQTTFLLRNVPRNVGATKLLRLFEREGVMELFNFLYVPVKFGTGESLGYGFLNFVDEAAAEKFAERFQGFEAWDAGEAAEELRGLVEPVTGTQGLDANVERYRNSPLMHPTVPDAYRPMIFRGGERQPFPEPTQRIKAPRKRLNRVNEELP